MESLQKRAQKGGSLQYYRGRRNDLDDKGCDKSGGWEQCHQQGAALQNCSMGVLKMLGHGFPGLLFETVGGRTRIWVGYG
jgi:hypothetical protein